MKQVRIARNNFALVDDDEYEKIAKRKWYMHKTEKINYARCKMERGFQYMHRMVTKAKRGEYVDHINQNGLDNRKSNLRICTKSQNGCNRGKDKDNTSGYKGVTYITSRHKRRKRWRAQIVTNKKLICIGYYFTKKEAAIAYDNSAKKYHKEFAKTNF